MVVEDDAILRECVADTLSMSGFRPVVACNGREALLLLRGEAPAPRAILLDMVMPEMNGWQLRAELLTSPALCQIPVIIMSGAEDADEVPGHAFIRKPFGCEQLLRTVARVTRLRLS
jgi:CheY-like chemotaxis protein